MVAFFILFVASVMPSSKIPNPLSLDPNEATSDYEKARATYATRIQFEGSPQWWSSFSEALFITPELLHAKSFEYAKQNFLTDQERLMWFAYMYIDYEEALPFELMLYSSSYPEVNVIKLDSYDCKVKNIILINDKGVKVGPSEKKSFTVEKVAANVYGCINKLSFPHTSYTADRVIDHDTEWIQLWLIAEGYRVYFQYKFQ